MCTEEKGVHGSFGGWSPLKKSKYRTEEFQDKEIMALGTKTRCETFVAKLILHVFRL